MSIKFCTLNFFSFFFLVTNFFSLKYYYYFIFFFLSHFILLHIIFAFKLFSLSLFILHHIIFTFKIYHNFPKLLSFIVNYDTKISTKIMQNNELVHFGQNYLYSFFYSFYCPNYLPTSHNNVGSCTFLLILFHSIILLCNSCLCTWMMNCNGAIDVSLGY